MESEAVVPVNPSLTAVMPMRRKSEGIPLMTEVPVEPELAPYLVTSSKSVVWVQRTVQGMVRSAIRTVDPNAHFVEVVDAIRSKSLEQSWGTVFPLNLDGVLTGQSVLREHGFEHLTLLTTTGGFSDVEIPEPIEVVPTAWLPEHLAVLVPTDREFVGVTLDFGNGSIATVIHNAARGVVVLCR